MDGKLNIDLEVYNVIPPTAQGRYALLLLILRGESVGKRRPRDPNNLGLPGLSHGTVDILAPLLLRLFYDQPNYSRSRCISYNSWFGVWRVHVHGPQVSILQKRDSARRRAHLYLG